MLQSLYLVSFNRCSVSVSYVPASILDAEDPAVNTTHTELMDGWEGEHMVTDHRSAGKEGYRAQEIPPGSIIFYRSPPVKEGEKETQAQNTFLLECVGVKSSTEQVDGL